MSEVKLPPVSIEAEQHILGCILFSPDLVHDVVEDLPVQAFYSKEHQTIYECIVSLYRKDEPTDFIGVSERLQHLGLLDKIGGVAVLSRLTSRIVSATNLDRYISLVKDKYFRRLMIECGHQITEIGYDQITKTEECRELAEEKFFKLLKPEVSRSEPEPIEQPLTRILDNLDNTDPVGIPTKIIDLDEKIIGLVPKNLYVIAARPSMGKTWLGINIALSSAEQGKNVFFVSAEMGNEDLGNRFLAMATGIDSAKIYNKKLTQSERENITLAYNDLIELNLVLDDASSRHITTANIRSKLRKTAIKRGKPDLLIVDYLQKLGSRSAVNRAQVIGEITGDFKDIAKEFDIPVICLAQINRGVENRQDKRPSMSDLKDSGDIEQDADVIMTLYRDEYYNPNSPDRGVLEIEVAKNRNGSVGVCRCLFDPKTGSVQNLREYN